MSLEKIKSEYLIRYPNLKYHNARFWENESGVFCQAYSEVDKKFYGNTFKIDLSDYSIKRVV